jgi:hypothetical protein
MIARWSAAVALAALVLVPLTPAAPALKDKSPVPAGTWTVTYHPNRAVRVYTVTADGEVTLPEFGGKGKLAVKDREIILDLSDGKLERWTLGRDGRLFVEHFNPRASYPNSPPDQIGIGVLKAEGK